MLVVVVIGFTAIATLCVGAAQLGAAIKLAPRHTIINAANFIIKTPYAAQANDLNAKCQIGLHVGLGSVIPHYLLDGAIIFHFHRHTLDHVWLISNRFKVERGLPTLTF